MALAMQFQETIWAKSPKNGFYFVKYCNKSASPLLKSLTLLSWSSCHGRGCYLQIRWDVGLVELVQICTVDLFMEPEILHPQSPVDSL